MPAHGHAPQSGPNNTPATDMALFSLRAALGLDSSSFEAGLKRTQSMATGWASTFKSTIAGAFTAGAVVAWSKTILDHAGKIVDLADAYKLTTEQVQVAMQAAAENGVAEEQLMQITAKLGEQRQKALEGDEKAIGVFARMGISLERLRTAEVNNFTLLKEVGTANAIRSDELQNQADMMDLLGSKSAKAAEAIRQLSNVSPISIISDDDLRKLDQAGDKMSQIWLTTKALSAKLIVNSIDDVGKTGAFFDEMLSKLFGVKPYKGKPDTSGPEPDWSSMNGGGYDAAVQAIEAGRANAAATLKAPKASRGAAPTFRSSADGALQSMGGYWFGAVDSSKQDLAAMRADIKRIADSVNQVASQ